MEKFYLEEPTLKRKEEALEYLKEFIENNSAVCGSEGLNRCAKGITYETWLEDVIKTQDKEYAEIKKEGPSSTYFMVREEDNKIVGMVNIRHYLDRIARQLGGHIGGSIRPSERGKGYSEVLLYLALLECNKLGIDDVMIDCEKINIKSERAIIAIGGEFEREFYYQPRKTVIRNYWVNVDKSINKNEDKYGKKVLTLKK